MPSEDGFTREPVTATVGVILNGLLFDSDGNPVDGNVVAGLETVGVVGPPGTVKCLTVRTRGTPRVEMARVGRLTDEIVTGLREMPGGEYVRVENVVKAIREITDEALRGHGALMDPDDLVLCVPLRDVRELLRGDLPMTGISQDQPGGR